MSTHYVDPERGRLWPAVGKTVCYGKRGDVKCARITAVDTKGDIYTIKRHGIEARFTEHDRVVGIYP